MKHFFHFAGKIETFSNCGGKSETNFAFYLKKMKHFPHFLEKIEHF